MAKTPFRTFFVCRLVCPPHYRPYGFGPPGPTPGPILRQNAAQPNPPVLYLPRSCVPARFTMAVWLLAPGVSHACLYCSDGAEIVLW